MVVSSMASSVLQLCSRRGGAADGRNMATAVPTPAWVRCTAIWAVSGVALCGVMQADASTRCIDATQDAADATPARGAAPDDGVAVQAFLAARAWLDAESLPSPDAQAAQVELEGVTGVCVLLRQNGRLVGVGEDSGAGGKPDALMLRRALGRAIVKALGDETVRRVRAEIGDGVTAGLALELELAGAPLPLLGRTIADAAARVVPGQDGIAVRRGDEIFRAFPGRLLASDNADRPDGAIAALLIDAGLPAKDLPEFAGSERVSLARFATVRLREARAGAAPEVVTRGGRTIDLAEIDAAATRSLATQLTARLAAQVVAADERDAARGVAQPARGVLLLGTLNPTADAYDPPFADARQTALAAMALAFASQSSAVPGPTRARAGESARALAHALAALPEPERVPVVECMALAALRMAREGETAASGARETIQANGANDASEAALAARVAARAPTLLKVDGAVSPAQAAFAALALAGSAQGRDEAARVAREILAGFRDRPGALLQAALPLALLARELDGGRELDGPRDAANIAGAACAADIRRALAALAVQLAPQQVGADPANPDGLPADLVGGLMPPSGPRARVDAECLRHGAALAIAFAGGAPEVPAGGDAMVRRFVRFLAQHTAADPWVGGFRRPDAIRGLVRGSLATDDCPPEATAFGVLLSAAAADRAAVGR
jgi:hypothetical protein